MRPLPVLFVMALLAGALAACEVLSPDEGEVSAHSIGETLFLANKTDARIYHFVVGRETAALINWAPHLNPDKSVGRATTARIPHEEIFRAETEQEAVVYWWHALEDDGPPQPGEIHSLVVGL